MQEPADYSFFCFTRQDVDGTLTSKNQLTVTSFALLVKVLTGRLNARTS